MTEMEKKTGVSLDAVCGIVRQAGALFLNREAVSRTTEKGRADFVTEVDVEVQQFVRDRLAEAYPEVQFVSEEKDNDDVNRQGLMWVLDPVDGTTNLIHDYRASAISLALMNQGESVMGIIYNPYRDEMYTAQKGNGAFCNGKQIHVSRITDMEHSLISIGTSPYYKEMAADNFRLFEKIYADCVDIRRCGSAAVDLSDVAAGRLEAYFEKRLKLWDFAAGMLLVTEAGGLVLNCDGGPVRCDMVEDIVAGVPEIVSLLTGNYF